MRSRILRMTIGAAIGLGLAVMIGSQSTVAASGWRLAQWSGTRIKFVTVDPESSKEVAAVADGVLELSHDSGSSWVPCLMPAQVNVVAYDPVQAGRVYAGTDTGIYVSSDNGLSWKLLESFLTARKIVVALTVADQYIFASMYDGAGTPVRVLRFTPDGSFTDTGFPDGNADCFAYDSARHRLYVGAAGGVYSSDDDGASWQGGSHGAGSFTTRVVVKPGMVWQLSADGLFRTNDDGQSWNKLAGPGDLNGTYYGSGMHLSGLVVSNGSAYYGAWNIGYPYQFLADYAGGSARSILDARVNDVVADASQLWAATDNGLWVNSDLVSSEAVIRRPVIIVPGILGSLPTTEALKTYAATVVEEGYWDRSYKVPLEIDPIDHTYDGLINYLQARGYRRDQNLFVFPYNWMQDNTVTAKQLAQKIYDVRQACGCTQVDIVAHSMGGLIARSYIQSDYYQHDIANLIQLATPNAGAVDDYAVWESGEYSGITTPSSLFNSILSAFANPQTDPVKVALMHSLMPAVGQLLPAFDYLDGRRYPTDYPRNTFLEALNQPGNITELKQRVALYVVGAATKSTLAALTVGPPRPDKSTWQDGMITASTFGAGDTTVLQSSLEVVGKASLLVDATHGGVVTAAAPFVAQTLMGGYVTEAGTESTPEVASSTYLAIYASGPVALHLTAPGGQTVDDAALGIPGAYYSGSTTTPQLMMIPQPVTPGPYQLTVTATGSGTYLVGFRNADASLPSEVGGIAVAGQSWQYQYDGLSHALQAVSAPPGAAFLVKPFMPAQSLAPYSSASILPSSMVRPTASAIPASAAVLQPSLSDEKGGGVSATSQHRQHRYSQLNLSGDYSWWWRWLVIVAAVLPLLVIGLILLR